MTISRYLKKFKTWMSCAYKADKGTAGYEYPHERYVIYHYVYYGSAKIAKPFTDGSAVISRLCPVDYHRFHFPISGKPTIPELINGSLFSVNPIALRKKISIFWQNKRYLSFIEETPIGRVAIFLIGATCVGSVKFSVKF